MLGRLADVCSVWGFNLILVLLIVCVGACAGVCERKSSCPSLYVEIRGRCEAVSLRPPLHGGVWGLNSGLQVYTTTALPSEPSCQFGFVVFVCVGAQSLLVAVLVVVF